MSRRRLAALAPGLPEQEEVVLGQFPSGRGQIACQEFLGVRGLVELDHPAPSPALLVNSLPSWVHPFGELGSPHRCSVTDVLRPLWAGRCEDGRLPFRVLFSSEIV